MNLKLPGWIAILISKNKYFLYPHHLFGEGICILYTYDAWGNHTVKNHDILDINGNIEYNSIIGNVNPIRYRGYYYDVESSIYYLNTRYYDPTIGRFINADEITILDETQSQIHGLNLYMYCMNNPVGMIDPSGRFFFTALLVGLLVGAVIGGTVAGVSSAAQGNTGWSLVGDIFLGGLIGGVVGGAIGIAVAGIAAAAPAISAFMGTSFAIGSTFAGGAAAMAVTVTGAQLLAGGAVVALGGMVLFAKASKGTGKDGSTDKPSWVNKGMVDPKKSAQQNAKNMLNNQYGQGMWNKSDREFSKIMKWIQRSIFNR